MTWNLPNKLTMLRVIMVPFFVAALLYADGTDMRFRIAALVLFVIASYTDHLDGKIARKYNLITNFGKFMDPLADKLLVCSALICFVQLKELPAWVVIVIIAREFIISGFRLIASDQGIVIAASMWGKAKTVSQMACIVLLLLNFKEGPGAQLTVVMTVVMTALTIVSLIDYLAKNRQVMEEKK